MKALLTEAIGTFFLVLTVGLVTNQGPALGAVSIGLTLMVMVYAGGRLSGAHYNPAVSVAAVLRGALPSRHLVPYWAAQFAGAILASLMTWKFMGHPPSVEAGELTTPLKAVVGEAIATFGLAYVILHVATSKATEGNSYFGLAIGGTVAAFAIVFGPITGGAFNPAVGLGPAVAQMVLGRDMAPFVWVYLVGPMLGAVAAAFAFKYQEGAGA